MISEQILVKQDELDRYEQSVNDFLGEKIDADRFQSMRLQQGIYGQRQEGVNMVRIKIPGGRLNPDQADNIASMLEEYSEHDVAHITTRQAIQVHYVPLPKTPAAIRHLAGAGLTSREACNNTVRNMTGCPLAGVCPSEHTDIGNYIDAAASHFLRHPLTQHLPRKFKISFSGCETDCAQGMIHDLGVVATRKDGRFGFKILAGGGLGHKPRQAITVDEFVTPEQLLASMEAVISVHNRFSDRKRRAKSRIKFLVDRFGAEGFIEKYREELERTLAALADAAPIEAQWHEDSRPTVCDPGAPRHIIGQKQAGLNIVPVHIPIGDITAPQLHGISELMRNENLTDLRTTQDQNLMIIGVADNRVDAVTAALKKLGLGLPSTGDNVVACPGTSTCRLGITSSKILGSKLSGGGDDLRIRVSGCHNGCAQPESGDIGIYGEGKRLHGKLVPHYQLYLGGDGRQQGRLGFKSLRIPSARIEAAIELLQSTYRQQRQQNESFFHWAHAKGPEYFADLLADIAHVGADQIAAVISDHGDATDFKVLQLGGGECAGAAQETVAANFAEAANERNYRNAFLLQRKYDESIECAEQSLRLIGNSLLDLANEAARDSLTDIASAVTQTAGDLGTRLGKFIDTLDELKEDFDQQRYTDLNSEMDQWTLQAADHCQEIDKQLDLSASVSKITAQRGKQAGAETTVVDLTSYGCPLHYIKARHALRNYKDGDVISFLFASNDSAQQASTSLQSDGHQVLGIEEAGTATRVSVRKAS